MRARKWICFGVPILIGVGMLLASQPKEKPVQPPLPRIDFDYDNTWDGRPLTPAEKGTVGSAINNIKNPPPSSITYKDAAGNSITVACSTLAKNLQAQLDSGDIQAETKNKSDAGEYQGEINVNQKKLATCSTDAGKKYLEELLIHEETHKGAQQEGQSDDENEIEALAAELAYKDSIGLDSASSADYQWTLSLWKKHRFNYLWGRIMRILEHIWAQTHICFIEYGEGISTDMFKSFAQGDTGFYEFNLSTFLRASDLLIHEDYYPLGPEHCLALISGGEPGLGHGRILGLDIYQGRVQPPSPYFLQDFTVPPYDPMFLYSMAHSPERNCYYFVDTLSQRIVSMPDMDGNLIPEMVVSMYANAMMFPQLVGMRSVEPTRHRYYGFGLIVNHEDAHYTDAIRPHDTRFFLPDWNGDNMADECIPVHRYEFVTCKPHLGTPSAGDPLVQIFASWDHPVEVWATDSLGETFHEHLGSVWMEMPHMDCGLMRPLMAGEFIIAMDMETGGHLALATKVAGPTPPAAPTDVTIKYNATTGNVELRWTDTGAPYYFVYRSTSPYNYSGSTLLGWVPAGTGFYVDYACANPKAFYYVTASSSTP
ncbi:MAG: hypothetical protein V1784_11735 [bacterium]